MLNSYPKQTLTKPLMFLYYEWPAKKKDLEPSEESLLRHLGTHSMCGPVSAIQKQFWVSAEHIFIYAHWVWQGFSGTVYFPLLHRLLLLNQLYLMQAFHSRFLFCSASSKGKETIQFPGSCSHWLCCWGQVAKRWLMAHWGLIPVHKEMDWYQPIHLVPNCY